MTARYDSRTALVVTDVQNDFADPGGSLSVPGGHEIIPTVNAEVRAALDGRATVVYTQDWHPDETPHFVTSGGPWPPHCVHDTWGAQLHPDLVVAGPVVRKGTGGEDGYSGFTMRHPVSGESAGTGLDDVLREHGVERVVIVGLALDYCVRATALDAVELGYRTELVRDGTAPVEVHPGDGDRALAELVDAGVAVVG